MKWYSTDSLHTNAQRSPVAVQVRFSVIFSYPFSDFRFRYISTAMKNIKFSAKTQLDEVVIDRFLAHQCTTKPGCCSGEINCFILRIISKKKSARLEGFIMRLDKKFYPIVFSRKLWGFFITVNMYRNRKSEKVVHYTAS